MEGFGTNQDLLPKSNQVKSLSVTTPSSEDNPVPSTTNVHTENKTTVIIPAKSEVSTPSASVSDNTTDLQHQNEKRKLQLKSNDDEAVDQQTMETVHHLQNHPEDVKLVKKPSIAAEKALSLCLSTKFDKHQYLTLRQTLKNVGFNNYPSYRKILAAKRICNPSNTDIEVTDRSAEVKLQALLDHTVKRLAKVINTDKTIDSELCLTCKWGFDGASRQKSYYQPWDDESDDASIFMCSFVPSKLKCGDEIIWENPNPSSPLYCRPIFFKFFDENKPNIMEDKDAIEAEIADLKPTIMKNNATVKHTMVMIMIDSKFMLHNMSDISTETCDICKTVPSEMNDLGKVTKKTISTNFSQYGLSTVGAWIKCMECLLQISYRLEFKTWQAEGENEVIMNNCKKAIQERFRKEIDLLVDEEKEGWGTRNDRRTARGFFIRFEQTALITGIDEILIKRFAVILRVIASGYNINADTFSSYALETAELYVKLYSWYPMPVSVHKLLIHMSDILRNGNVIPIGHYLHKGLKYRDHYSYRSNRGVKNERLFKKFLINSDPYMASLRKSVTKITEEMISLVLLPEDEEMIEIIDVDDMGMMNSDVDDTSDDSDSDSNY